MSLKLLKKKRPGLICFSHAFMAIHTMDAYHAVDMGPLERGCLALVGPLPFASGLQEPVHIFSLQRYCTVSKYEG